MLGCFWTYLGLFYLVGFFLFMILKSFGFILGIKGSLDFARNVGVLVTILGLIICLTMKLVEDSY